MQLVSYGPGEGDPTGTEMICAACGGRAEDNPCPRCGRNPMLRGRYRLLKVSPLDPGGLEYEGVGTRRSDGRLTIRLRPLAIPASERLVREMQPAIDRMRSMDHPAILGWRDAFFVGNTDRPALCTVQDQVEGSYLFAEMAGQPWSSGRALDLLEELAGVLAHLHALEPSLAIANFDPARLIRRTDGSLLVGTAAPWQLQLGSKVDEVCEAPERRRSQWSPASDLYALAVLGVALLTGSHPRTLADPMGFLVWQEAVRERGPLTDLLARWLSPDPAGRPRTAQDARRELRTIRQSTSPEAEISLIPTGSLEGLSTRSMTRARGPRVATEGGARKLNRDVSRTYGGAPSRQRSTVAQVITVSLVATMLTVLVVAAQSFGSRMGWINSAPWLAADGAPTESRMGLSSGEEP